eukprot:TRINITY_DN16304_c0_g1_i1.p1 TRINITY_DN16304_c0_g1~~TRINITY_DN16304_c0_g1_i1.p1  ORF type:complete len:476 (-),score=81.77 TRINITY_DN16304_c0_g1_i1:37-1422(-)
MRASLLLSKKPQLLDASRVANPESLRQIFVRDSMAQWSRNPFIVERAEGVYYWDVNGKRYLDGISGIYCANVGHRNRRVLDAMQKQAEKLTFSPPMHGTNPVAIQLANLLADLAPADLSVVKLSSVGSEATEAAVKMSRQYHKQTGNPGKYKVISRYLSWHGATFGALSASGLPSRKTVHEPLMPGFVHVFPPTCYRCPFGKEYGNGSCGITCADMIERTLESEDPSTVAAVLVEPIGHTGGIIDPPEEYLPRLREICTRHNVLLVFDEVITGIGRTGNLFAAETFGVTPDILCTGKGLSGGYSPLSATICRRFVADALWETGFIDGHTFDGNPISCAAGIAVLSEIAERDLLANARKQGQRMRDGFREIQKKHGIIGDIRGKGLFLGIELVADRASRKPFPKELQLGMLVGRKALENGLLCRFDPSWLAFGPPLVITDAEVDELLATLDASMASVLSSLQ